MPPLPGDICFSERDLEREKLACGVTARSQDLEYCLRIDSLDSHFLVALDQLLGCALPRTYCVTLSKLLTSLCLSFHICKMGP